MPGSLDIDPALASALRHLRDEHGVTQQDVDVRAGMNVGAIGKIERSERSPMWMTVRRFADALGISLVELAEAIEAEEG